MVNIAHVKRRLQAIIDERGLDRAELSIAAGLSHSYIGQLLNRSHSPSIRALTKIAAALGMTLAELCDEEGGQAQVVPIVGIASAGEGWSPADDLIGEIEMRVGGGEPVALEVRGDSMLPVYRDGDVIIGTKSIGDKAAKLIGRDCIVMTDQGDRFVKYLVKGTMPGRYTLRSYNPASPDIQNVRMSWVAQIVWVKRKG